MALGACATLTAPAFAQDEPKDSSPSSSPGAASTSSAAATTTATGQPSEAEMMKMMMEMSKLNDNHKLLASLDGNWTYTVKFWMNGDPTSKPDESKGTATRKSIMGGRYVVMNVSGKMQMPGPDGKMKDVDFTGMGTEAYDNAKQKFVGTWLDSMGTGIMMSEGTYDAASKTFTYTGDYEMAPGVKQQIRETLKLNDKNHMAMEWFEDRGGKEVKTMEIDYARK
ncbi:MAG: DUF1579 domain-containing protein [Verrucomicrobiota bacterium]|nr:DUF1579 domain-containing protein [Verrucomicrobiota bacterium]